MKPSFSKKLIFLLCIAMVAGSVILYFASNRNIRNLTRECARMNDFPESTKNIGHETEDNKNSIQITLTFNAEIGEINQWVATSPGTKDVSPRIVEGHRFYKIEPTENATRAELEVDDLSGNVTIVVEF